MISAPFTEQAKSMKRALIYGRVSTHDQEADNQVRQLKEYAHSQGWTLVDVIIDVASGGSGRNVRGGLDQVFNFAHQRKFDVLLFWSLCRLSREGSRTTIGYLQQLESHGVDWHSFTEPYISSLGIFADAIIALLSALNRQERVRIGERTRAGLERARADGKRLGRPPTDASRITRASALRAQKMSFAQIGREMGISRGRAFQMVKEGAAQ
ncbi:MAG: recombinase family protein [Lentisphaerae bacterium]|nr:recombinase family protein [Lentisphaerota bacterium]